MPKPVLSVTIRSANIPLATECSKEKSEPHALDWTMRRRTTDAYPTHSGGNMKQR